MKKDKKGGTKRSSKNLKINTRIIISTILGIAIPLIIIAAFSSIFLSTAASVFNFSTVTTKSYSLVNQIQWSQTMSSVSKALMSEDDDESKRHKLNEFVSPLEELGCRIYIECDGADFYSTSDKKSVLTLAQSIAKIDTQKNLNYFGENGVVIVNHVKTDDRTYLVLIANRDYAVNDISSRYTPQDYSSLIFTRTGLIIAVIALIFILSILSLSLITSRTISKPMKKLSEGANEIANGNLDFVIDYESTNEIGTTVQSFNDMTKKLRESIRLQNQTEQNKKEIIAGLAHDLRTPLTSIKGYCEGIMDGIANTPEKQDLYMKTIYSSAADMEKLLDDLLTVSRLELGKIQIDTKTVNLNDFFDECAKEIAVTLEQNGFDFEYKNSCDDDFYIDLDTDRFQRVIHNIISNSVKYAKKDVKGRVKMFIESYQKSAIISIADNGIGLDSNNLRRIFDSFFRADPARTKVNEGSGIGLAVCKQIVELHGGHIWATSKENEGLTILISLERKIIYSNEQKNLNH